LFLIVFQNTGLLRTSLEPYTDKQIELVTTFADQAMIAIENVRLFDEVQARTEELSESLQQMRAERPFLNRELTGVPKARIVSCPTRLQAKGRPLWKVFPTLKPRLVGASCCPNP
jgi:hypothetical protein